MPRNKLLPNQNSGKQHTVSNYRASSGRTTVINIQQLKEINTNKRGNILVFNKQKEVH